MIDEVAIVIAVHDNGPELKLNLPKYLGQLWGSGLKVIVVNDSSTDDTSDVLKRMKADYPQLYTTFIPASSHRNRRRLALTIGAKAAESRWIAVADIRYAPETDKWLSLLAQAVGEDINKKLAVGVCRQKNASLPKRYKQWRKTMKLKRKVTGSSEFELPLNNILTDKELIIRKGKLTANSDYAVWVNEARLTR